MDEKYRILVVDDDPDLIQILTLSLESDFEVVTSSNGIEALEVLPKCEPDIFIIDVMMPMMSGFELVRRIKYSPEYYDSPVILLSGRDSPENIKRGYAEGVDLFLAKPIKMERLQKNIQVFVDRGDLSIRKKSLSLEEIRRQEAAHSLAEDTPGSLGPGAVAPKAALKPAPAPRPAPKPAPAPTLSEPEEGEMSILDPFARAEERLNGRRGSLHLKTDKEAEAEPQAEKQKEAEEEVAQERRPVPESAARILVVDDDEEIIAMACEMLGDHYQVLGAPDGMHGVQKANSYRPDILVIDGMMPRMSGYQMCQLMRQSADFRNTPIIFMSAKSSPRDRKYVQQMKVSKFLSKPFPPESLFDSVEAITNRSNFHIRADRPSWRDTLERENEAATQGHGSDKDEGAADAPPRKRTIADLLSGGAATTTDDDI